MNWLTIWTFGTIPAELFAAEFVTFVLVNPNDGELKLFVVADDVVAELTVLLTVPLDVTLETLKLEKGKVSCKDHGRS